MSEAEIITGLIKANKNLDAKVKELEKQRDNLIKMSIDTHRRMCMICYNSYNCDDKNENLLHCRDCNQSDFNLRELEQIKQKSIKEIISEVV